MVDEYHRYKTIKQRAAQFVAPCACIRHFPRRPSLVMGIAQRLIKKFLENRNATFTSMFMVIFPCIFEGNIESIKRRNFLWTTWYLN